MIGRPPILILDEPTVGADVQTRAALIELIRELQKDGTTICYSTHYLTEVEALGASISIFLEGREAVSGSIADVVARADEAPTLVLRFSEPQDLADLPAAAMGTDWVAVAYPAAGSPLQYATGLLGDRVQSLTSLEIVRPTLETAYLKITNELQYERRLGSAVRGSSETGV